jgi:DNA-binding transcriptional MerR regulator
MGEMELGTTELVPIGRFARLSGLTVKALRHYDEIGLLRPTRVDAWTGYRYYALAQARKAEAIRRLRSLEVPLDEIRALIGADEETLRERLAVHRARIEGRAVETRRIVTELDRLIDGKEPLVPEQKDVMVRFELKVDEVPASRALVLRERVRQEELSTIIPRDIESVGEYLKGLGRRPAGPPLCVCPFPDADGTLEAEIGWLVDGDVPARPPIEATEFPATRALVMRHVGPYEQLARSYRLMAEAMEEHGLEAAGAPREIYESDPQEVADPNDYVTEIVWPIGRGGEFKPSGDKFTRRLD